MRKSDMKFKISSRNYFQFKEKASCVTDVLITDINALVKWYNCGIFDISKRTVDFPIEDKWETIWYTKETKYNKTKKYNYNTWM